MNGVKARDLFTFIIGALIFVGRTVKRDSVGSLVTAQESLDAGRVFCREVEARKLVPMDGEV